jgi:hypothetical protein
MFNKRLMAAPGEPLGAPLPRARTKKEPRKWRLSGV